VDSGSHGWIAEADVGLKRSGLIPLGNIWASISTGKTREVPTLRESAWMEFSETTGIAVAEHAAESGRIATFLLVPVVLDLDRLLAQSFANLEEMP
jgi:hypothetical protein